MFIFFSILLGLIAINAVFILFSFNSIDTDERKVEKNVLNDAISKIYRYIFLSSKF